MVTRIYQHRPGFPRIAEWMDYKNLDDDRLAGRVGVDRVTVTRWRNQERRPEPEYMPALAIAFDCEEWEIWAPPPPKGRAKLRAVLKDKPDEIVDEVADLAEMFLRKRAS
jgi:transcriptional regulator with XRE-family HTH domain